jgi:hypothetical protein
VPPSNCSDSQGRRYPEPGWATGDSMPDRAGALGGSYRGSVFGGPLEPAEGSLATPAPRVADPDQGRCGFSSLSQPWLTQDLAYLPETDLGGVPLDGPRRLVRFESGPYTGKIRPDLQQNRWDAVNNLFDKVMQRLIDDGIRVIGLYVDLSRDAERLERAFNLPESPSFNAAKPPGMLIAIHDEEQVLPILHRVWEELGITHQP